VLRATWRLLRPGGRTAFHTIYTAPGLDRRARARAHRSGPWAVASIDTPVELLRRAGFTDVDELDVTDEFRAVAKEWIDQWDVHRDALTAVYGESEFESRQCDRRMQLRAVEDGLLRRSLFVGSRPSGSRSSDR
jgi:hypothetical protein